MITMHPGRYITQAYLVDGGMTQNELAVKLKMSPSAVSRLLNEKADLSPEMAIRLSEVIGRTAESWMRMQMKHSLKKAMQSREMHTQTL